MTAFDSLTRGREAFSLRAWNAAYQHLSAADQAGGLDAASLQLLAQAAHLTGRAREAIDFWTRAHHEYLRVGETLPAIRCTFWLAFIFSFWGEHGRSSGWLGRGRRLIAGVGEDNAEAAYLLFLDALGRHWSGDYAGAMADFERTSAAAARFDEPDLTAFSRMSIGEALIELGQGHDGIALLDEVMASVLADELSPFAVGIIYCAVIGACWRTFDMGRAREWTGAFNQWCESQPDLMPFRGECMVKRAGIMQLQGVWPRALEEAQRACAYDVAGYQAWLGDAYYQQAEVYRLRGAFAEAEEAFRLSARYGGSSLPGHALLRLAQGRVEAAVTAIARGLAEEQSMSNRCRLLPAHIEISLEAGDIATAGALASELADMADGMDSSYLRTLSAQATGHVLLARGDSVGALNRLRTAMSGWQELDTPYEAARTRYLIGLACRALGDEDGAEFELRAACDVFERLGAMPDVERVQRLAPQPARGLEAGLSEREIEVLRLVATGKSNRAIAEALVLSEHTVRRHLQNAFAKIGVSSRSAATAYAFQHGLV